MRTIRCIVACVLSGLAHSSLAAQQAPPAPQGEEPAPQADARPDPACQQWIQANLTPVRSIDPADVDFADLQPLKNAIGDATVVLLGEQSRGDGNTFLAKTRLIKFLHEQMDFDVLVWEAGLFDCTLTEAALAKPEVPLGEAAAAGIFEAWAAAQQVVPLLEYARASYATPRPLIMAGMDIQLSGSNVVAELGSRMRSLVEKLGPGAVPTAELQSFEELLKTMKGRGNITHEQATAALTTITSIEGLLADPAAAERAGIDASQLTWVKRMLTSARKAVQLRDMEGMMRQKGYSETRMAEISNFRDGAMADNVVWLRDEAYKGKKVIVWAASIHLLHGYSVQQWQERSKVGEVKPTGDVLVERLRSQVYTIAFCSSEGEWGYTIKPRPAAVPKPEADSLDGMLASAGPDYLFLDLSPLRGQMLHCMSLPMIGRLRNYDRVLAPWPAVCDGVFFLRKQVPATRVATAAADTKPAASNE